MANEPHDSPNPSGRWRTFLAKSREFAPVWTLLALILFFSVYSDSFLTLENAANILNQVALLAIMGTGITFVLLTAQIDLSVSYMATFAGVVAAYYTAGHLPQPWPIVAALLAAGALGWINGVGTARLGIPSFMVTLAMSLIASGLSLYLTRGRILFDLPPLSETLGSGRILGVKWLVLVAALTLLVGHLVLRYTRFGRYVYMTGANPKAAELAGVNTRGVITAVMVIGALTAGLAGVVGIGRLGSATPTAFDGMLIDAIGAVVLGGTSLFGGVGGIPQTIVGLLILGVLRNGLDQVSVDIYMKTLITGVILLAALVFNILFAGRKEA
ncbi:ABC transporter permease [Deinococcota bacterium DY0809b]